MIRTRSYYWNLLAWLVIGLCIVGILAPLSDGVERISSFAVIVASSTFLGLGWWEDRRKKRADQSSSAAISSNDQT